MRGSLNLGTIAYLPQMGIIHQPSLLLSKGIFAHSFLHTSPTHHREIRATLCLTSTNAITDPALS